MREVDVGGRAEIALELTLEPTAADGTASAPSAPPPAAPPAAAPAPVFEMPVIEKTEKTVIERTYVETPAAERTVVERSPARAPSAAPTIQRAIGYTIIAAGLAAGTTGGVLAFQGANRSNDAKDRLAAAATDDEWNTALADFNAGKKRNETGWIVAGVGAAALLGGIIVVATVPERSNYVSLAPWFTAGAGGLTMRAAF